MNYQVYFTCSNDCCGVLIFKAKTRTEVICKVKDILIDNDGGTARISGIDNDFYMIIER